MRNIQHGTTLSNRPPSIDVMAHGADSKKAGGLPSRASPPSLFALRPSLFAFIPMHNAEPCSCSLVFGLFHDSIQHAYSSLSFLRAFLILALSARKLECWLGLAWSHNPSHVEDIALYHGRSCPTTSRVSFCRNSFSLVSSTRLVLALALALTRALVRAWRGFVGFVVRFAWAGG
jgi:hypothetical protein